MLVQRMWGQIPVFLVYRLGLREEFTAGCKEKPLSPGWSDICVKAFVCGSYACLVISPIIKFFGKLRKSGF